MQADNKHPTSPEDYITGTSDIMDVMCASRQQASNITRRLHHWHIRHHGCYVYKQTTSTQHPPKTTSLAHTTSWMIRVQADNKHPTSPEDYITGTSDSMDVTCASRQQAPSIPEDYITGTSDIMDVMCASRQQVPNIPEDYITGTSDIMDVMYASRQQASNIPETTSLAHPISCMLRVRFTDTH